MALSSLFLGTSVLPKGVFTSRRTGREAAMKIDRFGPWSPISSHFVPFPYTYRKCAAYGSGVCRRVQEGALILCRGKLAQRKSAREASETKFNAQGRAWQAEDGWTGLGAASSGWRALAGCSVLENWKNGIEFEACGFFNDRRRGEELSAHGSMIAVGGTAKRAPRRPDRARVTGISRVECNRVQDSATIERPRKPKGSSG